MSGCRDQHGQRHNSQPSRAECLGTWVADFVAKSPLWSGFLVRSSRSAAGRSVEFLLDRGRQILEVTEKSDYLPNLAVGHDISPGGHGSPARAILNDVKVL